MSKAITAIWHGGDYQARVFWQNALNLLREHTHVSEVTYEADGPKAFDDVVVRYDRPIPRSGPERIVADFHQIKWHVHTGGRFGYENFAEPEFIGAKSYSLLERLRDAKNNTDESVCFTFLTTDRIADDDLLVSFVSGNDCSLLTEKLFNGTTDRSRTGKIRKCWREHLGLSSDDELREIVDGLRIVQGYMTLDQLRDDVNLRAELVGLKTFSDSHSDFRYDTLAQKLKMRRINVMTKELLFQFCEDEELLAPRAALQSTHRPIAVRSFLGPAADAVDVPDEDVLWLTEDFRNRYLREDLDWQHDIRPKVEAFLRAAVTRSSQLCLILDAHASIAFLAGTVLHLKSGVDIELVQKGRVGTRHWRADDGTGNNAPLFEFTEHTLGSGQETAIAISVAQPVEAQVRSYIEQNLDAIGQLIVCSLPSGPGQRVVTGGEHAALLAEQVAYYTKDLRGERTDQLVHLFAACPNSLLFFLGQQHRNVSPTVVYEFDFDEKGFRGYQASFTID